MILQWVPGHSQVPRNEKADATAKDMAHKERKEMDHWNLLIYIKAKLQKARSTELLA